MLFGDSGPSPSPKTTGLVVRIGVDAQWLEYPQRTGVARYLLSVLYEFGRVPDGRHEYVLFSRSPLPESWLAEPPFTQVHIDPDRTVGAFTWRNVLLPEAVRRNRTDVLLSPAYASPVFLKGRSVVVIHDISFQAHPEWFTFKDRLALRTPSRLSALRADAVVTDSAFTKQEIVTRFRVPPNHIHAIPLAVGEQFTGDQDPSSLAAVLEKYGIIGPYIINVGAIFSRRNLPVLLRAFARILDQVPHALVVVGPNRTVPHENMQALAHRLGIGTRTVFVDFAADEDVAPLYTGADVSAYLSVYEGFGLPALESLACGTPVVASDRASVPEVVGEAGVFVDPNDTEAVANALLSVLANDETRAELSLKGIQHAARFSWRRTAGATLEVLERVANG